MLENRRRHYSIELVHDRCDIPCSFNENKKVFMLAIFFILPADILPHNAEGYPATREFLMKVVDILLDFVKATNDRNAKVLDFHHPADMMRLLDLEIPDTGLTLQQLLLDCSTTLKYQVKTGKNELVLPLLSLFLFLVYI